MTKWMTFCKRSPCLFKETDVKRAILGVKSAGLIPMCVTVAPDGTIRVEVAGVEVAATAAANNNSSAPENPWDNPR
jgi:hypothetical protein